MNIETRTFILGLLMFIVGSIGFISEVRNIMAGGDWLHYCSAVFTAACTWAGANRLKKTTL